MLHSSLFNQKTMQYSLGSFDDHQSLFPNDKKICQSDEEAFFPAPFQKKRAVLTVEAALVGSLLLLFLAGLGSLLDVLILQQGIRRTALVAMREQAVYAAAAETIAGDSYDESLQIPQELFLPSRTEGVIQEFIEDELPEWLRQRASDIQCRFRLWDRKEDYLTAELSYRITPLFMPLSLSWQETVRIRKWTGRSRAEAAKQETGGTSVFLSRYPSVFHHSSDSRYLHTSYRAVPRKWIHLYRNSEGKRYTPSRYNNGNESEYVFITEYGTTYHDHIDPALNRNFTAVPMEDVENRYRPAKGE